MKVSAILQSVMVLAIVFSAVACSEPTVCTNPGKLGIVVNVRDALTGRPAAYQTRLITRSAARVDTFPDFTAAADSASASQLFSLGIPGVYTVTVEKDGYSPWISAARSIARNG
jgi:hypothetical protein